MPILEKPNQDIDLTCYTKINSKWSIDLNVKCKNKTLLEESVGENLGGVVFV